MSLKPSNIATSAGSSNFSASVAGFFSSVRRLSTGLMQCFSMAARCSAFNVPLITYVVADFIMGFSLSARRQQHCSAESALWSNCPGRYSTEKQKSLSSCGKASSYTMSTGGSEKTVPRAFLYVSSLRFSIS